MNAPAFLGASKPKAARVFEKHPEHWYVEPERCTAELLRVERFVGPIWDPACGSGNILRACIAAGYHAVGSDIVRRVPAEMVARYAGELDFIKADATLLACPGAFAPDIITNPPYMRALGTEAFIRKALAVARGKVAIFAELRFLASEGRARGLFAEHCPHRVWHVGKRPSCPPGTYLEAGGKAEGGQADFCWLVFDLTAPPARVYQGGWILPEPARAAA